MDQCKDKYRVRIDGRLIGEFSYLEAVRLVERTRPRRGGTAMILGKDRLQTYQAVPECQDSGAVLLVWACIQDEKG